MELSPRRVTCSKLEEDGHWCGELEGDTILESGYILTLYFLGRAEEDRVRKAAITFEQSAQGAAGQTIQEAKPM
jgi:squalene-hopene/tetraprenyl-beta-curcumene cyclase